jgi:hypothetical protein
MDATLRELRTLRCQDDQGAAEWIMANKREKRKRVMANLKWEGDSVGIGEANVRKSVSKKLFNFSSFRAHLELLA